MREFRSYVLLILEQMSVNNKGLIDENNNKTILENILPSLLAHMSSENPDTKFNCLKIFTDIITQYLADETIYEAEGTQESTKKINELILKKLFPHYGIILSEKDPMP